MKDYFKVQNLCFGYLKMPLCIKDANFSAEKKDRVLLLASDDSGKTSFLKAISGFDDKYFGNVFFEGTEIRKIDDDKKMFSIIFDKPILLNSTIDKNLDYLFDSIGKEKPSDEQKTKFLSEFGLNFKLKDKIRKLSIFEKFEFCFLRAFIKNSRIVFIDDILKNNFQREEVEELKKLTKKVSNDKLVFLCASEKSFLKQKEFFDEFKPTKTLYLSKAKLSEFKNFKEFEEKIIDLNACSFCDDLERKEGFCILQNGSFYLSFDEKFEIKIDKKFNLNFEKMKLSENENEDIVLVYKKDLEVDLTKNNDVNNLFEQGKLAVFSKVDGNRVIWKCC